MYTIKVQNRNNGNWNTLYGFVDVTLEKCEKEFATFEYSSMSMNYQIVDENGNVIRNWLTEQSWYKGNK